MKVIYGDSKKVVDYVFWIVLIFFTNPGGILQAFGEDSGDGGINVTDFLFVILGICFVFVFNKNYFNNDKTFNKISRLLLVFLIYYIVVFAFFIPQFKNLSYYSVVDTFIKIRFGIMNFFLVHFVYVFYLRSYKVFFKYFIFSSIVILTLFLITFVTGVEILPMKSMDRRFVSIDRVFMYSYGLMPILISMGSTLIVFKFNIKYKYFLTIGFVLMSLTWVLSLYRREIFGTVIVFLVAAVVSNYLNKKKLIPIKKTIKIFFLVLILLFIVKLSFPKYLDAIESSVEQTYHIFKYGKTISGQKDVRLGFGKAELQKKIGDNFIIGTGFDNRWRVSEEAGFEASDYPFLAAIAMFGVIGMLFFLPVYINFYKSIFGDLKFLRKSKIKFDSFETYVLIFLIVYFVFEILNYTYWFLPASLFSFSKHHKWYIFFSMFFAARKVFYSIRINNKSLVRVNNSKI